MQYKSCIIVLTTHIHVHVVCMYCYCACSCTCTCYMYIHVHVYILYTYTLFMHRLTLPHHTHSHTYSHTCTHARTHTHTHTHTTQGGVFDQQLQSVHYQSPPWSTHYPELVHIFDDHPCVPVYNTVQDNQYCLGEFIDITQAQAQEWLDTVLNNTQNCSIKLL